MNTECPNPWSTADLISMGISTRAQRLFLEQTLWAMDRITNLPHVTASVANAQEKPPVDAETREARPAVAALDYEGAD